MRMFIKHVLTVYCSQYQFLGRLLLTHLICMSEGQFIKYVLNC